MLLISSIHQIRKRTINKKTNVVVAVSEAKERGRTFHGGFKGVEVVSQLMKVREEMEEVDETVTRRRFFF